ncbi:hypothetical protein SEUCBS140593_008939 [Sporothrix eucalyptigena]|uniref:Calpain catalytic domain-containing protein n=1 Tax=Sporothrix eucalyptigena TaxID=1812306 RepID=A0ABP0CQQ8_9PEZI
MSTFDAARTSSPSPSATTHGSNMTSRKKPNKKKNKNKSPQQTLAEFWNEFQARTPAKITSVFPQRLYTKFQVQPPVDVLGWTQQNDAAATRSGVTTPTSTWSNISVPSSSSPIGASTSNAAASYETAAQACRAAVARIVHECHRTNEKFTDSQFNLELDPRRNCLRGLVRRRMVDGGEEYALQPHHTPRAVHRVDWIFEKPVFVKGECSEDTKKGFAASDVQQGKLGDCWWIAAVATIAHRTDLMQRICVARDEACGVYGFVFQRDGAWFSVVVDDNLYLHHGDFATKKYDATGHRAREHRQRFQRGSEALSFARCEDANETWLPLLEKAFAKAHGDYGALVGGWCSEGMEDLTGGVSTTVVTNRVLDKDRLWRELEAGGGDTENKEGDFVFGVSLLGCGCYLANFNGLTVNHCYSVLQVVEATGEDGEKVRLVKIRNPWGQRNENTGFGEWHGPWSDGSKEWNAHWFKTLNHTFGDNGVFWMSYEDMLNTFGYLHRTRLFDAQWTVVQQWASVGVSWVPGYLGIRFIIDVKVPGLVVIVLSQLDDRYFRGLRGQYTFTLHFVLRAIGDEADGGGSILSIVYAPNANEIRSVSCEVTLPAAGRYEVLPQVKGQRNRRKLTEADVVRETIETNPEKLRQIGQQYDAAHAKSSDVVNEDLVLEARRDKRVERARAKKKWQKEEKQRAREKKYRDEMVAWVKRREEEKEKKREKKRKQKERKHGIKNEDNDEASKEDKKKDDEEDNKNEDEKEGKYNDKGKKEGEREEGKKEKEEVDDDDDDDDSDSDDSVELGPDPRPVPEPNFDSDSDHDNSDDLLDDSDDDIDNGTNNIIINNSSHNKDVKTTGNEDILPDIEDEDVAEDHREDPGQDAGSGHGFSHGCCVNKNEPEEKTPWNAVCVLGLRVYSKDPATTIELMRPEKRVTR